MAVSPCSLYHVSADLSSLGWQLSHDVPLQSPDHHSPHQQAVQLNQPGATSIIPPQPTLAARSDDGDKPPVTVPEQQQQGQRRVGRRGLVLTPSHHTLLVISPVIKCCSKSTQCQWAAVCSRSKPNGASSMRARQQQVPSTSCAMACNQPTTALQVAMLHKHAMTVLPASPECQLT